MDSFPLMIVLLILLLFEQFLDQGVLHIKTFSTIPCVKQPLITFALKSLKCGINQPGLVTEMIDGINTIKYYQGLFVVSDVFRNLRVSIYLR